MHLKKPDLTETYLAFILSEGKDDCPFVGKSCSKLGITLEISIIRQVGRQVGLFHQQQIYNIYNKNKVCKYCDGWDNTKKAKKLYFHCDPF